MTSYLSFEAVLLDEIDKPIGRFGFVEIHGFMGILQTIAKLGQVVTNLPRKYLVDVGDNVRGAFAINFEEEREGGTRGGIPWRPLALRTREEREKQGYGREHPILVRTGSYKRSWVERGAPYNVDKTTRSGANIRMEFGSRHPYAEVHEGGSEPGVPFRRVIGHPYPEILSATIAEAISKEYTKYIGGEGSARWGGPNFGGEGKHISKPEWRFAPLNFHFQDLGKMGFVEEEYGNLYGGYTFGVRQLV